MELNTQYLEKQHGSIRVVPFIESTILNETTFLVKSSHIGFTKPLVDMIQRPRFASSGSGDIILQKE